MIPRLAPHIVSVMTPVKACNVISVSQEIKTVRGRTSDHGCRSTSISGETQTRTTTEERLTRVERMLQTGDFIVRMVVVPMARWNLFGLKVTAAELDRARQRTGPE
jgi:hypothetical protein